MEQSAPYVKCQRQGVFIRTNGHLCGMDYCIAAKILVDECSQHLFNDRRKEDTLFSYYQSLSIASDTELRKHGILEMSDECPTS